MIVDGVSLLLYGKDAYVQGFYSEEEVKLNVSLSVLNFLHERGIKRLSFGHGEDFIMIEEVLSEYNGG